MLNKNFIPTLPFQTFKWRWATVTCREGLNDPVILLGVLYRMRKLEKENRGITYSSSEFYNEMLMLSDDIRDSLNINLTGESRDRNLIRNQAQYWKAVGLIPASQNRSGVITLTDFGRKVADREISQAEFSAITIQTFKLPNVGTQSDDECKLWLNHNLIIYPLRLILHILCELQKYDQGYLTPDELRRVVIPLSGCNAEIQDYVNFLLWYRAKEISLIGWPDTCVRDNDHRMVREFLLFLSNYGYLNISSDITVKNHLQKYNINENMLSEIEEIINAQIDDNSLNNALTEIRKTEIIGELERKKVKTYSVKSRPNQANFRKLVLQNCKRCIITNVKMPEILEAAHIKPYKYNGEDTIHNGFAMRTDIHTLFDTGHLRISVDGDVQLSQIAREDYGAIIPPVIRIPEFTNKDFLRWRWDNYTSI